MDIRKLKVIIIPAPAIRGPVVGLMKIKSLFPGKDFTSFMPNAILSLFVTLICDMYSYNINQCSKMEIIVWHELYY